MSDDFYSVAIPEPTTVLGRRLRPFSLGHVILLHRIKSSFVTENEPLSFEDLALSVLICSLNYEDGCSLFNERSLGKFFKKWHRNLEGGWMVTIGLKRPREIDYIKKAKEFADYVQRGSSVPHYSYTPSDFRDISCPPAQLVKTILMKEMGFAEPYIMDRSWALCLWDYVTLKAISGQVSMTERSAIEEARKLADELQGRIMEGKCQS